MKNMEIIKLRNEIDALDGNLIKIIQKRIKMSKRIGKIKAEFLMPLSCLQREKEVLQKASITSKKFNVNPELSEKILGLIISECRNAQIEFIKKPNMIIIGDGKMGKRFSKEFKVPILKEKLSRLRNLNGPKIILLAIPFSALDDITEKIKNFLNEDDLVIDISSTKMGVEQIFSKLNCGFLATHPLFGANTEMSQQKWIITSERRNVLSDWFENLIGAKGCKIVKVKPEIHDKAMAILQGLNHFMLNAFLKTIEDFNFDAKTIEKFSTACSRLTLEAVKKVSLGGISTSSALVNKPMAKVAINKFVENMKELK